MSQRPLLALVFVGRLLARTSAAAVAESEARHTHTAHKATDSDDISMPTVAEMMGSTFEGLGTLALKLSSEADGLAAEVHGLQQDETDRMARMKAELEQSLKDQAPEEKALEAKNQRLRADIRTARAAIGALRREEKELRGSLSAAAKAFSQQQGGGGGSAAGPPPGGRGHGGRLRPGRPRAAAASLAKAAEEPAESADRGGAAGSGGGDALEALPSLLEKSSATSPLVEGASAQASVSHVPMEEADEAAALAGRMRSLAAGVSQVLLLERRAEARYEAEYTKRAAARRRRIVKLKEDGKKLELKLKSLRQKRDKLRASLKPMQEIYRRLAQAEQQAAPLADGGDGGA